MSNSKLTNAFWLQDAKYLLICFSLAWRNLKNL